MDASRTDNGTSFTIGSILKAAFQCARNVRWKASIAKWTHQRNIASNCMKLWSELDNGSYRLGGYTLFCVTEPKKRLIRSPKFRDRVVQRAMCNNGLYDDLTRGNIYDNGACQLGKGTSFAMDRLECHLQRHFRKHGNDGWCLRLDIHKFFDSIPHGPLKEMVKRKIRNPEYRKLVTEIIDSFEGDVGIGLGSQISQLLAISYLSGIDHYIKEQLKIRAYVRYSDDLVLVHESKEHLQKAWNDIRRGLEILGLELNPKSTLHPLRQGVKFLKFKFMLTKTGKVVRLLDRRNPVRIKKRLKRLAEMARNGERTTRDVWSCFDSWKSHVELGNSYSTIRRMKSWLETQVSS